MNNQEFVLYASELVEKFKNEKCWNRSEEHIQTFFTTKMLERLGWNSEYIKINQGQAVKTGKIPDILLHHKNSTLLVIESKDASKKDMLDGHYKNITFKEQLFGYCRAEGIFWGVLTNFVEWRVYSVFQNRIYKERKFAFTDLLWKNANKNNYTDLLSEEGLAFFNKLERANLTPCKGRWDDDSIYYPQQKEIKEKFFTDLKKWRAILRDYLVSNYQDKYSIETLEIITQRMLDRLIFTDYCADNDIIMQDRLHAILESKKGINSELTRIFEDMDEKFNTELFSVSENEKVEFSDEVIRPVINELADTDFKKLSVNVIGEVYENYLGEILNSEKTLINEDERKAFQKKKSQGIYYTPENIVDFIVQNTVGEVLSKCKTIAEIEQIRVLDPACGSGSFLIRVFDEFLLHYQRIENSPLFHFEMRKRILQNNIYGVDLDDRAVEITKLNLLVKALEGSGGIVISGRKILPNLKLNIRCGNSLISGELIKNNQFSIWQVAYEKELNALLELRQRFQQEHDDNKKKSLFHEIEIYEEIINSKLNESLIPYFNNVDVAKAFNYSVSFPEIISNGGFDCVVGNPPYIDSELMTKEQPECRNFISENFEATKGNWDIYIAFLERASKLTKANGYWAYITPDKWISKPFGETLRTNLRKNISHLVRVGSNVFSDARVDSIISIFSKKEVNSLKVLDVSDKNFELINNVNNKVIKPPCAFDYLFSHNLSVLEKLENTVTNNRFPFVCENACATSDTYKLKPFIIDLKQADYNENEQYKVINTGTIGKYVSRWGIKEMTYLGNKYIRPIVKIFEFENNFRNSYGLKAKKPKIIVKGLTLLDGCLDLSGNCLPGKSTIIVLSNDANSLKFVSAFINSKIAYFYLSQRHPSSSYNGGITFTADMVNSLPIPIPSNEEFLKIIAKVDQITSFYETLYVTKDENQIKKINIKISAVEKEINEYIYDLYSLNDTEKVIISQL